MSQNPFTRVTVIMAGGAGERFWPLSRQARPKQLLKLTHPELTMLEEAVQRIAPLIPAERTFIATARTLVEPIRAAKIDVPDENVIGEPCKRNTAGCLAFAAATVLARHGENVSMAVLTADHRIGSPAHFRATVTAALAAAEQEGALVTIGVTPDRPETGLGYIEVREGAGSGSIAHQQETISVLPVTSFREKPDKATAERFVASHRYFWNSGMFFWTLPAFLRELAAAAPDHAKAACAMSEAINRHDPAAVDQIFAELTDISIDYALMEKASHVLMARADFPWDDVGAWDALDRGWIHDTAGNVCVGEPVLIDAANNIIYNEPGTERLAVAVIGVENLIIVVSEDGVLVVPKSRAQDVKKAVAELKARGSRQI